MDCDLLISGAAVVTIDEGFSVFDPGYIAVEKGAIVGVGPTAGDPAGFAAGRAEGGGARIPADHGSAADEAPLPESAFRPRERLDGRGLLALPGYVNAHTHAAMAAFRGAGDDVRDRLTRYIFPMEKLLVDADLVYRSTRYCLAEMALSGTTSFADMYYFEEEVARATKEFGLRAVLGQTVVDFPAPDARAPYSGIERGLRFASVWSGEPTITPCVAPHATYTVDAPTLRRLRSEAERLGAPLLMHVAETADEAARFKASHGSPVRYLDSIGLLWPGLVAVHAIYVDESDIELFARRGVAVAHCPVSNAKAGRPIAPAMAMAAAGVRLGLGTDGPISGNGMDMQGVVGLYPKLQKVLAGRRDVLSAKEALRAATLGGAEALGLGDRVGSLEAGKRADIQLLDAGSWTMQPAYDWYSAVVYGSGPADVVSVLVDGKLVVDRRRLTTVDGDELKSDMSAIGRRCAGQIARLEREATSAR